MLRNCLISLACVLVVTLVLIASPLTCLFVVICVLFTLVDVGEIWDGGVGVGAMEVSRQLRPVLILVLSSLNS